jgi:hypothetical protein
MTARRSWTGGLKLFRDFRLLVYLFIGFRLMLVMVYQPILSDGLERGISAGGDLSYYHALSETSDEGRLPFRDYWMEFPPVWPLMTVVVHQLTAASGEPNYTAFASLIGLIMLAFETGNLILLRRIGSHLYGQDTGLALAWIYAVLLAPVVFLWWTFEAIVAFALLLGIWWLITGRQDRSALAVLFGALTKFVPLVLLGAAWRFLNWRMALRFTVIAVGGFVLIYLVIIMSTGNMGAVSLVAQFNKSSYGTVWALIDGNFGTGVFGAVEAHFDVTNATTLIGNPPVIPSWLRLLPFAGFGLYVFLRTRRADSEAQVAFVTLTVLVFLLWAQGWSPQWLALIIPLVLLNFPDRNGVLAILLLSLMAFTEYPLLFIRTGDTGGVVSGSLRGPLVALIVGRTMILTAIVVALLRRLVSPIEKVFVHD